MSTELNTVLFNSVLKGIVVKPEHLKAMEEASASLAARWQEEKALIPWAALNGLLPDGASEALEPAQEAIVASWPTFVSETADGGMPYLRAVTIMSMVSLSADPNIGSALYLLLIDPFRRQGDTREASLRAYALSLLETTYESAAQARWKEVDSDVPPLELKALKPTPLPEATTTAMAAAIEKAMTATQILSNYPTSPTWASSVSQAIVEQLDALLVEMTKPVHAAVAAPLKSMAKSYEAADEAAKAAQLADRRTRIMWWLLARYSPSRKVSYRTLPPFAAAHVMGWDLDELVTRPATPELEAVLLEAWYGTFSEQPKEASMLQALREAGVEGASYKVKGVGGAGIKPVTNIIAELEAGARFTKSTLSRALGIHAENISAPALALWIFRTMQAGELLK